LSAMSSAPRKQAPRLPRPAARYWKGKAPKGVDADADSDSEGEQEEVVEGGAEMIGGEDYEGESGDEEEDDLKVGQLVGKQKAMNIALKDVNISREGKVIVAGREESGRTAIETLQKEESDESEEESDEGDAKPEQEEETSSEDDEPPKPQFRPVFVPKRARATIAERELLAEDTEEAIKRKEEELEERRKQSHDLVAESIKRELAEKEKEEDIPDVDDTDGLDPEVEFETWRLRELARIKRDQEAALEREREREEVERRRAMPEEQRLKEDLEHAKKSRDDKPKGQQKFLQKYWHKGAFHQILTRHDFTEATESTVDISLLPKVMQVKNFGKRSRTKYTHLLDQDTTTTTGGFGGTAPVKSGNKSLEGSGCFNCGGPHLKKGKRPSLSRTHRRVKVAVVGSGLAGLTAAYLLTSRTQCEDDEVEFEVHLFDKAPVVGMDAASVSLPLIPATSTIDGANEAEGLDVPEWRVDVPMRSFQGGYYPQLIALYKKLGVSFRPSNFTYSFSLLSKAPIPGSYCAKRGTSPRRITTKMIYNGASGLSGLGIPSIFYESTFSNLSTGKVTRSPLILFRNFVANIHTHVLFAVFLFYVVICYFRMIWLASPVFRLNPQRLERMRFAEWITETTPKGTFSKWTGMENAWREYAKTVLVPLFSAVCTAPEEDVLNHPVEEFLDYLWLTLGTSHYVVLNGVRDVVARLTTNVKHIHLSANICGMSIESNSGTASVQCRSPEMGVETHAGFDHIIFATQASRAVPLLQSMAASLSRDSSQRVQQAAIENQIRCLKTFIYRDTLVVNHLDDTLMPDHKDDWRDLNLICAEQSQFSAGKGRKSGVMEDGLSVSATYTMATHKLPRPRGYPMHVPAVYQTTNPVIAPKEDSVLSVARLERAVVTVESKEALKGFYMEKERQWWQCAGQGRGTLGNLQGAGRRSIDVPATGPGIWICGSYAYSGIPLLEGCVVSARNVVEQGIWALECVQSPGQPW
ncbi:hypothetical protein BDN72DRAFT_753735, partial [Pluteus cervinus]